MFAGQVLPRPALGPRSWLFREAVPGRLDPPPRRGTARLRLSLFGRAPRGALQSPPRAGVPHEPLPLTSDVASRSVHQTSDPADPAAQCGRREPLALVQPHPGRAAGPGRAHLGAGDGALARHRRRLSSLPTCSPGTSASPAASRARWWSRRPGFATSPAARCSGSGTTASCPASPSWSARCGGRAGADPALHPDHRLPPDPAPARARTVLRAFLALDRPAPRARCRGAPDDEVREAPRAARPKPSWPRACSMSASWRACATATASGSPTSSCLTSGSCPGAARAVRRSGGARAEQAGFDGVELHYAHAYTMASFLSRAERSATTVTAGRASSASGCRSRSTAPCVRRVGAELRRGLPVPRRRVHRGRQHASTTPPGSASSSRAAGMDYLSLSQGRQVRGRQAAQGRPGAPTPTPGRSGYECMPTVALGRARAVRAQRARCAAGSAAAVRAAGLRDAGGASPAGSATLRAGRGAARRRRGGHRRRAARQSLADPDWFRKLRLGRGDEVRRCVFTNYCEGLDQVHKPVTCKLWDHQDGVRRTVAPPWEPAAP